MRYAEMPQHRGSTPQADGLLAFDLSRRTLFRVGGVAAIGVAGVLSGPRLAYADSDSGFAGVRERSLELLTGGEAMDPDVPEIRHVLYELEEAVGEHLAAMERGGSASYLWPDLNFSGSAKERSSHIAGSYARLRSMALAYAANGSSYRGDPDLLEAISDGLEWLHEHKYNEDEPMYGNWYYWEIGAPQALTATSLLLYGELDPARLEADMRTVDHWCPEPTFTATNLLWTSEIVLSRGALVEDEAKMILAREAIPRALEWVEAGDGFYSDGSFIQHRNHPYNGSYGASLVGTVARLSHRLTDSPWALDQDQLDQLLDWTGEGLEPWLYQGSFLVPVRGREITRPGSQDHFRGANVAHSLMWLSQSAPEDRAEHLLGVVRHTIESDWFGEVFNSPELGTVARLVDVASDDSIQPVTPTVRTKQYPRMDRMVHHQDGFAFAVAMSSRRIFTYESINEENLRGWHTGSGAHYLYNDDLAHYDDAYWATVDHHRLPGTTVPVGERELSLGQSRFNDRDWAGGVASGSYGVTGMEFMTFAETEPSAAPQGVKSWFTFDDRLVCVGSDIRSTAGARVESIAENRRLVEPGQQFTLDGDVQGDAEWDQAVSLPVWAHLEGGTPSASIGYLFHGEGQLHLKRESRTGSWADVNTNSEYVDHTPITHEYLTVWTDHGVDPEDGSYAYTILPGADAQEVQRYAADPQAQVLSRDSGVHAVRYGGTFGANFWDAAAPAVDGVECRGRAAILVRRDFTSIQVAVADPTHRSAHPVLDNTDAALTPADAWATSSSQTRLYGEDYAYAELDEADAVARWQPEELQQDRYVVEVWLPEGNHERSPAAAYRVRHAGGETTFTLDQQGEGGEWVPGTGELEFDGAGEEFVELVVSDSAPAQTERTLLIADAVRFKRVSEPVFPEPDDELDPRFVQVRLPWPATEVKTTGDRVQVAELSPAVVLTIDVADSAGEGIEIELEADPLEPLQTVVDQHAEAGHLSGPIVDDLQRYLDIAERVLDLGQAAPAVVIIERFIQRTEHLRREDHVTEEARRDLVAHAEDLIRMFS